MQKELPGLRGFSARNLKYMRTFYGEWAHGLQATEADSALANAEIERAYPLAVRHLQVSNWTVANVEAFLSIGFTHHRTILEMAKRMDERQFYIRKCAEEHMSVESLGRSIRADDYHHQGAMPNNFLETTAQASAVVVHGHAPC